MLNWQDLHRNRFLQKNLEIKTVSASTSIGLGVLYIFLAPDEQESLYFSRPLVVCQEFSPNSVSVLMQSDMALAKVGGTRSLITPGTPLETLLPQGHFKLSPKVSTDPSIVDATDSHSREILYGLVCDQSTSGEHIGLGQPVNGRCRQPKGRFA